MTATLPGATRTHWILKGACRGEDPELFFPIGVVGISAEQTRRAVAVCHRCVVRAECLRYALASRQQHGTWGGLTEQERTALIRRRQARRRRARQRSRA